MKSESNGAKVALVTGGGQGVGKGVALALAAEGTNIAVVGRTAAKLEAACVELRARGVTAEPFVCDVADTGRARETVEKVADTFGRLDILINNAYHGAYGSLLSMSDEAFQTGFGSGPFATFAFMTAAHPHLKATGEGNIVNVITSAIVRWDPAGYGAYAAAKVSVQSMTRTAAVEWGGDGIRVNCISPSALTPSRVHWAETHPEEAEEIRVRIPLGRVGDCEQDIGRAVVAICGPDARYLTGATIPLDGGQARF